MRKASMGKRDWSELFVILFDEFAKRLLCLEDLGSFSMVCRSWRDFIIFKKHQYQPLLSKGIPWLMLTHREINDDDDDDNDNDDDDGTRNFFSLSTNKLYNLYLPEVCGRRCWGSPYGWLITFGIDLEIHLLNPITRARLPLPPQSTFKPRNPFGGSPKELRRHFSTKGVLGLLPSSSSSSSSLINEDRFIVFMLYACGKLAFARPGDKAWTAMKKTPFFIDITFFNGQIFGIKNNFSEPAVTSIFICDIYKSYQPTTLFVHGPVGKNAINSYYLIEMAGELHFVARGYSYEEGNKSCNDCEDFVALMLFEGCEHMQPGGSQHMPTTDHFVVYRLDLVTKEFTKLESFEDHALFVGTNSSFSISVAAHPEFKGNCVYFTDDHTHVDRYTKFGRDMGVFDYKERMVKPFYLGPNTISVYCPPTFFTPNLW